MKDISFIIPVYNTPLEKLRRCLNSIFGLKSKFDIEVVVIDDGSKAFIRTFFQKEFIGKVKYLYKKNGGVSSARNLGLANAEGKYIFFVDADDVIIESAFNEINVTDNYQFILFDIDVIENQHESAWKVLNRKRGKVEKIEIIEELITSNKMNSPCSKLFLNDHIKQNDIRFDENMVTGEDMNFVLDYTQCVSNIYYAGKSAYCYQREESSRISRINNYPEIYLNNLSFLRDKLEVVAKKYNLGVEYIDILNIDYVDSIYNYISDLMTLKKCTLERKKRVQIAIQKLNINSSKVSRKKKLKYKLLYKNEWALIHMLAYIRKIYLRLK